MSRGVPHGDDEPVPLRDLAAVESPQLVQKAVRRFRRRTVVTALGIACVIVLSILVVPLFFRSPPPLPDQFPGAPGESIGAVLDAGPVEVVVLDARRLDRGLVGIHVVVLSESVGDGERLVARPGRQPSPTGTGNPPNPLQVFVSELKGGGQAAEVWAVFDRGTRRISLVFEAVSAERQAGMPPRPSDEPNGSVRAPHRPTTGDRHPIPSGRELGEVTLDMEDLGVPPSIWR